MSSTSSMSLVMGLLLIAQLTVCMPPVSRIHARVEPGTSYTLHAGITGAEVSASSTGSQDLVPSGQLDIQWGYREPGGAAALRLKIPSRLDLSAIDAYFQLHDGASSAAGVGVEASLHPALYGSYTVDLRRGTFATWTHRVVAEGSLRDLSAYAIHPQIAIGVASELRGALVLGLVHRIGEDTPEAANRDHRTPSADSPTQPQATFYSGLSLQF